MAALRAAILVISDTAWSDPSTDKAGDSLVETILESGKGQWDRPAKTIVKDDVLAIQRQICAWSDGTDPPNLVLTTGGTGFAVRDNTPEAVAPLLNRHAPGLVHGMLAASLEVTAFAMMSRPVAGVRKETVIITLPGSPKGAKENLLAVLKLLPHACQQAAGADSRSLHAGGVKELEKEAGMAPKVAGKSSHASSHDHHGGHGHHDHHGHKIPRPHTDPQTRPISNEPSAGPSQRNRKSPYPIIPVTEALERIFDAIPSPLDAVDIAVSSPNLPGHVTAEDVHASEAVPAFRASIVDGYAIVLPEPGGGSSKGVFPVALVSHASATGGSSRETLALQRGQVARITTGAPLPPNANAVVMVEDTALKSTADDAEGEEKEIEISTDDIAVNENVRQPGSDVRVGDRLLSRDEEITAMGGEIGLLASVGKARVLVYRKPIVGILSSGDEIIAHDREGELRLGEVRDSNRPSLMTAVKGWGYEVVDLGIARDKSGSLEEHLRAALPRCDVLITTGGVSMGELDLLKPTIERRLGGRIHFGRVAMKPGKPTTFASVPYKPTNGDRNSVRDRLIFSLPGNPASALVTAHLFVLPTLQKLSGKPAPWGLPKIKVVLGQEVGCDRERTEYHRVMLRASLDGKIYAHSTGGQRSSRVGSFKGAQGLVCLPAQEGVLGQGQMVDALLMGDLHGL